MIATLVAAGLNGCGTAGRAVRSPATDATAEAPRLTVEAEGLRWFLPPNGAARPMPFGTPRAVVLASVERFRGTAETGTMEDCGAGRLGYANWADGLSLTFDNNRLVGWSLDRRAAGTTGSTTGIGPGSARKALEAAHRITVRETSLGTEFSSGDWHGLLDGRGTGARITDMWAGTTCIAR